MPSRNRFLSSTVSLVLPSQASQPSRREKIGRDKSKWLEELRRTSVAFDEDSFSIHREVEWQLAVSCLRIPTDRYLQKKKSLTPTEKEDRLRSLIRIHANKYIALLACAHDLTRPAARSVLRYELGGDSSDDSSIRRRLNVIIVLHYVNPVVVCAVEVQQAELLLLLLECNTASFLQRLYDFIVVDEASSLHDLFPHNTIHTVIQRACNQFAIQLKLFQTECCWISAYEAIASLSRLSGNSAVFRSTLGDALPEWRSWAAWRPQRNRIQSWDFLVQEEKYVLLDFLALDGPDFMPSARSSLLERLVSQAENQDSKSILHGRLLVSFDNDLGIDAFQFMHRLLNCLSKFCTTPCGRGMDIFVHLCLNNGVDMGTLSFLEIATTIRDVSIFDSLYNLFTSTSQAGSVLVMSDVLNTINLGGYHALFECLSPLFKTIAENGIAEMKAQLYDLVINQNWSRQSSEVIVLESQALGQTLRTAPRLRDALDPRLRSLVANWPLQSEIETWFKVRAEAENIQEGDVVTSLVDFYCLARIGGYGSVDETSNLAVEALFWLWQKDNHRQRQSLALLLLSRSAISIELRLQCITQIRGMDPKYLKQIEMGISDITDLACLNFAQLIRSNDFLMSHNHECWAELFRRMVELREFSLLESTVSSMDVTTWFSWLEELRDIFANRTAPSATTPPILRSELHLWSQNLHTNHLPVILSLESRPELKLLLEWILIGWEDQEVITQLLNALTRDEHDEIGSIMQAFLRLVGEPGCSAQEILKTIVCVASTTSLGKQACLHVLSLHQQSQTRISAVILAGWLQVARTEADRNALEKLAELLSLRLDLNKAPYPWILKDASSFIEGRYNEMIQKATRLGFLRMKLEKSDFSRAQTLFQGLGIEKNLDIEESLPSLIGTGIPPALVDVMDITDDGVFEMCFTLDHLKPLQRLALCTRDANLVVVRVNMEDETQSRSFCIHLYPEPSQPSDQELPHRYCVVDDKDMPPSLTPCRGRVTRAVYQLSRSFWRYLQTATGTVEDTHEFLSAAINNFGHTCPMDGTRLTQPLIRPTTCSMPCRLQWRKSPVEIRVSELRDSPSTVDVLLTAIHAAAAAGNDSALLGDCPIKTSNAILTQLNKIPNLRTFATGNLGASVRGLGKECEALLSWACLNYGGFLVPSSTNRDLLEIPSMPDVRQFVLANTTPEREQQFADAIQRGGGTSSVVFHGTTLDRLYPILTHGLRDMSGSGLGRNGASYGNGIYVADEPSISLGYTVGRSPFLATAAAAGTPGWTNGNILHSHTSLILGCELAPVGSTTHHGNIHVVKDSSAIMVRYVFFFPDNAQANAANTPGARHIVPPMLSAFASLRARNL